jgi:DNA-directed RNA polymerase specialized sigma subunit
MAAIETFHSFNEKLAPKERDELSNFIAAHMQELLAARSEDARKRIVEQYTRLVHEMRSVKSRSRPH